MRPSSQTTQKHDGHASPTLLTSSFQLVDAPAVAWDAARCVLMTSEIRNSLQSRLGALAQCGIAP